MRAVQRRNFLLAVGGGLLGVTRAFAQSGPKSARVAFLSGSTSREQSTGFQAVCARLAEAGWVEGKTITYDWRFNATARNRDQHSRLAAELLALRPDVLVVVGNQHAQTAIRLNTGTPIVMLASLDPVGSGLATSLARPGGNVTGAVWHDPVVAAKIVDMTREIMPAMRRLAVLYDADYPGIRPYIDADRAAAARLGIEFRDYGVQRSEDLLAVMDTLRRDKIDAVKAGYGGIVSGDDFQRFVAEASKHKVPVVSTVAAAIERGALLVYGPPLAELVKIVANQVDKILRGSKPAELPLEYVTRMELVVNANAAKALGIAMPHSILLRADRVIGAI